MFLGDQSEKCSIHLAVSASGVRFDALRSDEHAERREWNGDWKSGTQADNSGLRFEIAIPWKTLAAAGIAKDNLMVNFQMNKQSLNSEIPTWPGSKGREVQGRPGIGEPLISLGSQGATRCDNFVPLGLGTRPPAHSRKFTVRLHFAELGDIREGQRVFDVHLQGQRILENFDVVREAGGPQRALVRELRDIDAAEALTIAFVPKLRKSATLSISNCPILSGVEIFEQTLSNSEGIAAP